MEKTSNMRNKERSKKMFVTIFHSFIGQTGSVRDAGSTGKSQQNKIRNQRSSEIYKK